MVAKHTQNGNKLEENQRSCQFLSECKFEVDEDIMSHMDGIAHADAVMKKVYQARTLKELSKTVSEGGNMVAIIGNLLFDHLVIVL
jgi:hypothetical protein